MLVPLEVWDPCPYSANTASRQGSPSSWLFRTSEAVGQSAGSCVFCRAGPPAIFSWTLLSALRILRPWAGFWAGVPLVPVRGPSGSAAVRGGVLGGRRSWSQLCEPVRTGPSGASGSAVSRGPEGWGLAVLSGVEVLSEESGGLRQEAGEVPVSPPLGHGGWCACSGSLCPASFWALPGRPLLPTAPGWPLGPGAKSAAVLSWGRPRGGSLWPAPTGLSPHRGDCLEDGRLRPSWESLCPALSSQGLAHAAGEPGPSKASGAKSELPV